MTKVLVTGASPDRINSNMVLRQFVAEGFREILGLQAVSECNFEHAPAEILRLKPELTLVFGSCMPDESEFSLFRHSSNVAGSKLAFWLHDDPYEFDRNYKATKYADFVFTNDSWSRRHYEHPNVAHLPLGASRKAHFKRLPAKKDIDIFFCGVAFRNRIRLIKDASTILSNRNTQIFGDGWPPDMDHLAKNIRLPNEELADYYNRSLLTLNIGRHHSLANSRYQLDAATPGPRTFEAALAGTAQLYFVESLQIEEYFDPSEIVLFDSLRDLEGHVARLTTHPEEAFEIARLSQERALRDHTYASRARAMMEIVQSARLPKELRSNRSE